MSNRIQELEQQAQAQGGLSAAEQAEYKRLTAPMRSKPRNLARVVDWLRWNGFSVYGHAADLSADKGIVYPSCMDYSADQIELYIKLKRAGKLERREFFDSED